MTDCFALLDQPRRPWLDADALKTRFLLRSADAHPDRFHSGTPEEREAATRRFAELNSAYNCLREPRTRLQHLLELELGFKPKDLQQIPPDLANLFMDIAGLCRQTDAFLAEKDKTTSPLLLAQLFERGQAWVDQLMSRQQEVSRRQEALTTRLKALDDRWMSSDGISPSKASLLGELQEVWRLSGFFSRWTAQLQERITRLAL